MENDKPKILVLVEGAKTDIKLMEHLLTVYGIYQTHQLVSYNTNIYTLYNQMFRDSEPENVGLLQLLKENEKDEEKKKLFNEYYSDILLIFDLEPQEPQFSEDKIKRMLNYFVESSDMGKLYLNYPMVEAFYHMKSIPDYEYLSYTATLQELQEHNYKARVASENRNHDYRKFAVDQSECSTVIKQNIDKAWVISKIKSPMENGNISLPEANDILAAQLKKLNDEKALFVLCTCAFYIPDYNPKLIEE